MKTIKGILLGVLGLALVAGCATGPSGEIRDVYSRGAAVAEGGSAPMAALESRSSFAPAPAPASRAGLGTEWGETRESAVRNVEFRRESSRPADTGALYYNDRAGIDEVRRDRGAGRRLFGEPDSERGLVKWGLVGESGRTLPTWDSAGRYLVQGDKGERYSIVAKNLRNERIEVVFSVDGLDVLDGRPASFAKRGYILGPKASIRVDGFRKSATEVAAFRFSSVSNSFAALKHGETRNVGVIGVAVFRDGSTPWGGRPPYPAPMPKEAEAARRAEANPFPGQW